MMKTFVAVTVVCLIAATAALAAGPLPPKGPVTVTFPGDAGMAYKTAPGVVLAQTYCISCHSSAYVSTQPALSKAQWTAEVTKMKAVYAAPIPDDQVAPIADYLTTVYGKP